MFVMKNTCVVVLLLRFLIIFIASRTNISSINIIILIHIIITTLISNTLQSYLQPKDAQNVFNACVARPKCPSSKTLLDDAEF